MKLGKMQEELKCERRLLDTDRDTLETLAKEVQIRAEKMDELCKVNFKNELHSGVMIASEDVPII